MLRSRAGWSLAALVSFVALSGGSDLWRGDLSPSPLWLATASVTALAMLAPDSRRWSVLAGGVAGGAVASVAIYDESLTGMVTPVAANTLEVVIVVTAGAALLSQYRVRRTRDAITFMAITALATACSGALAVLSTSSTVIDDRWGSFGRWMLGDAVGLLLIGPLALFRQTPLFTPIRGRHVAELAVTLAVLAAVVTAGFSARSPVLYVAVALVLWLAIRYGPTLTTGVAIAVAVTATVATGAGYGPFTDFGDDAVVQVQLFNVAVAISSLVGGAHALRAERDRERLAGVLAALPDAVVVRDDRHGIVETWRPRQFADDVQEFAPDAIGADGLTGLVVPTGETIAVVSGRSGAVYERRAVDLDATRSIEIYRDISAERSAAHALRAHEVRLDEARATEQQRLARAIHDSPIQLIAAARMRIDAFVDGSSRPGPVSSQVGELEQADELLRVALVQLRDLTQSLMPIEADPGSLVEALAQFARLILPTTTEVVVADRASDRPSRPTTDVLYQVGREALSNAARHARASQVCIGLDARGSSIELSIQDNGAGFEPRPDGRRRFGLLLMRERVAAIGGNMAVTRPPEGGTTVTLSVPREP